jgi:hypothetical protein
MVFKSSFCRLDPESAVVAGIDADFLCCWHPHPPLAWTTSAFPSDPAGPLKPGQGPANGSILCVGYNPLSLAVTLHAICERRQPERIEFWLLLGELDQFLS